jgi:hypothetical protein
VAAAVVGVAVGVDEANGAVVPVTVAVLVGLGVRVSVGVRVAVAVITTVSVTVEVAVSAAVTENGVEGLAAPTRTINRCCGPGSALTGTCSITATPVQSAPKPAVGAAPGTAAQTTNFWVSIGEPVSKTMSAVSPFCARLGSKPTALRDTELPGGPD